MVLTEPPRRAEVWLVAFGAGRAGEPGKTRPAIVVSADGLATGDPADLVVVVPVSSSRAPSKLRIELDRSTGVERRRAARSSDPQGRPVGRRQSTRSSDGSVDRTTMAEIERALS